MCLACVNPWAGKTDQPVIRDVANYVTFFQVGSPRGAAKPCEASSAKTNADLRMKIGAVFRSCSEIIWPLDLPCLRALRRVAVLSYHKRPLRSTPAHGIGGRCNYINLISKTRPPSSPFPAAPPTAPPHGPGHPVTATVALSAPDRPAPLSRHGSRSTAGPYSGGAIN